MKKKWKTYARLWMWFYTLFLMITTVPIYAQVQPLTQLRFDIVGVRLIADPPALVVPKNIATRINTELSLSADAGSEATEALTSLTDDTLVVAELRGPYIDPVEIKVRPGQPIPIPPFALPGDYFLDQIRLEKDGEVLLNATPSTVPIQVISEILVTSVTSSPLSLAEIREKGIVIDENNFTAYNFSIGLKVEGKEFKINMPAVLPGRDLLRFENKPLEILQSLKDLEDIYHAFYLRLYIHFPKNVRLKNQLYLFLLYVAYCFTYLINASA